MRLKRIELYGFKSFCERVNIDFDHTITGIVGPNGCGKSNVLDAIRWVMGEQSMKSLRGKSRSDVIFNGSETRKGASAAEITLVLEDVPAEHRPEGFEDCTEIAITRRLSARGTSTYLVNKQPGRLKDIRMLFMGTGLGKHSYALIEQGRVNDFIQSSPDQRRLWIEEAAGISRYKEQRKVAEGHLNTTQGHVDRLNDVLQTLSGQRKSLQRQAGKARKYRVLSEEILDLDLYISTHKYLKYWARDRQLRLLLNDISDADGTKREAVLEREQEIHDLEFELKETSSELLETREQLQQRKTRLSLLEQTSKHLNDEIKRLLERQAKVEREQVQSEDLLETSEERTRELVEQLKSIRLEQGEHGEEIEQADQQLIELQQQLREADRAIEAIKTDVIEAATQVATHRNQRQGVERRREELSARIESNAEESEQLTTQSSELQSLLEQTNRLLERCRYEREYLEGQQEQLADALVTTKQDLTGAQHAFRQVQEQINEKQAKLSSLEELQAEYGDLSEASRALLLARDKGDIGNKMSIRGALVEMIEVSQEFEKATAAVLGDKLHYLVVRNAEVALNAIQYLNEHQLGRTGFLSMAAQPLHEPITLPEHPSVLGCLADHINTEHIFRPLVEQLLGHCIVVRELEDAHYIMAEIPASHAIWVSLSGDVMAPDGTIIGGKATSLEAGALQRRRQIKELSEALEILHEDCDLKEDTLDSLQSQLEDMQEQQETQRDELQQLNVKETALTKDSQRHEADLERLQERNSLLRREGGRLQLQLDTLCKEDEQLGKKLETLVQQQQECEKTLAETRDQMLADRDKQQALLSELTELKVKMAARREREESIQDQIKELQTRRSNLDERRETLQQEAFKLREDVAKKQEQVKNADSESTTLRAEITEQQTIVSSQGVQFAEEEARLQQLRIEIEELRLQIENVRERRTEILLEQREIQVNQQALDQEIRQQYNMSIGEALPGHHCRPTPHKDEAKKLNALKKERNQLGEVNALAEEEFNQIDEKYQFLRTQIEDLEKTIRSLRNTIQKINNKTKEQFKETFEAIRDHFSELFPKLFEGGNASLFLTEPDNLLETGVDITVRPPGKRKQNVTLLSGGEKALTTTALIFSFFLYKPSPFCILDEVDAPLDDVNIDRYNRLLRELSSVTQFIVITHNKRTMELADQLYGVTMQEPGVSTVVSVRIEEERAVAA